MAQSFQVAPEYVDEITFTTKVSSIEYRVSNQIQVSINIVGIRYRTSTNSFQDNCLLSTGEIHPRCLSLRSPPASLNSRCLCATLSKALEKSNKIRLNVLVECLQEVVGTNMICVSHERLFMKPC